MCSECYTNRLSQMQSSPYSIYDDYYKSDLELVYKTCGTTGSTEIPYPVVSLPGPESSMCVSEKWYNVSRDGEPCEQVAHHSNVSTVALYELNPQIFECSGIDSGTELCLPLSCGKLISYTTEDTCAGLETAHSLAPGDIRRFNPWVYHDCSNLVGATEF